MLSHGWAVVYESFLRKRDKPTYVVAQSGAKRANAALWAMTWIPPADWRKHKQRLECER
jgi:endonuclease YncB( thermonuclease family)